MKRGGIVHPRLAFTLASLGHGDEICVADAGLPVPAGVKRIDLAYRLGQPGFLDVLTAMAGELVVEEVTFAIEATDACPDLVAEVRDLLAGTKVSTVTHEQLKIRTRSVRVIVRTGETTPYANVILRSGVPFG